MWIVVFLLQTAIIGAQGASSEIEAPALRISVPASGTLLTKIELEGQNREERFLVALQREAPASPSPIELGFSDKRGRSLGKTIHVFAADQNSALYLKASVARSAQPGSRENAVVRLDKMLSDGTVANAVLIPVTVTVEEPKTHSGVVVVVALLTATIVVCIISYTSRSSFLPGPDSIVPNIQPTAWVLGRAEVVRGNEKIDLLNSHVRHSIRSLLNNKLRRLVCWLAQNPLVMVFPHHRYAEFLELDLHESAARSKIRLVGQRGALGLLQRTAASSSGRVFVLATDAKKSRNRRFVFLACLGSCTTVGPFFVERRRKASLRIAKDDAEEGEVAGWQFAGSIEYV